MLERDYKEALSCLKTSSNKATMVMCGSVLECALLNYLSMTPKNTLRSAFRQLFPRKKGRSPRKWNLDEMLQVARRLGILSDESFRLCDLIRNYRNLIHPSVEIRSAIIPDKRRANRSIEALVQALKELERNFEQIVKNIYIINIDGVPGRWIQDKMNVQNAISQMSRARGVQVTVVDSHRRLSGLVRNPPEYAIVINAHGELVPTPPPWSWRDFFVAIGNAVYNQGWTFVSIAGYPFWAYGPSQGEECGADGLNAFLSVVNARADCMNASAAEFTRDGLKVIRKANMTGLPHRLPVDRCAVWSGISIRKVFLRSGNLSGAAAVRIGRGWFIHMGFNSNLGIGLQPTRGETILGNLATAFALYM